MKAFTLLCDFAREWKELVIKQWRRVRWIIACRTSEHITADTMHGRLTIPTGDRNISAGLYLARQYEYTESVRAVSFIKDELLPATSPSPTVFFDIGANIGFIGIGLVNAGLVDLAVAFEPMAANYRLLEENIRQNHLEDRVFPVPAALVDHAGPVAIELSPTNHGDHRIRAEQPVADPLLGEDNRPTVTIPGLELDAIPWEAYQVPAPARVPDILWLDVQGFEGRVFSGAENLLQQGIPAVIEVCPYMIRRAGMELDTFHAILARHWTSYWVERSGRMVRYDLQRLSDIFAELGPSPDAHTNIILAA